MTGTTRSTAVSSFVITKGSMIPETYAAFQHWDFQRSLSDNLTELRQTNVMGAKSTSWLNDMVRVLRRRFDPPGQDRTLVELAQAGCDIEFWKPLMLWHMTRDEFLVRDFFSNWLFSKHREAVHRISSADVLPYLVDQTDSWSENTLKRVASGLLRMGVDFNLLRGTVSREFISYHLPEDSFMYLLHAMMGQLGNAGKVIDSTDWHMFLMTREDVEAVLLRLHQFRKLHFESAGSLVQLELPCASVAEYVKRFMA